MNSKIYTDMMEAYKEVYAPKINTEPQEFDIDIFCEDVYQEIISEGVDDNIAIEFVNCYYEELINQISSLLTEENSELIFEGVKKQIKKSAEDALINALQSVAAMAGWLPMKKKATKVVQKAIDKIPANSTFHQGKLFTKKGTPQNFKNNKRIPFVGTDPVKPVRRLPQGSTPQPVSPGQMSIPGMGSSPKSQVIKTPKETGGLLGTRNVPTMKDLGAAPKPAWGKGSTGGKLPKPPRDPRGSAIVKTTGSNIQTPPGALTKTTGSKIQTPPIEKVRVKDLGPTARSTVSKGGKTLKGDGVIDVTATNLGRTTGQKFKDLASKIGRNKGKLGAAVLGGAALTGMLSGDQNTKTADGYGGTFKDATAKADPTKTGRQPETPKADTPKKTGELNLPKPPAPKAPETKTPAPKAPETKTPAPKAPETKTPPKADTAPTETPTVLADKTPSKKRSSMADEIARLRKMRLASKMRQKGDDVKGADISDKQLDDAIKSGRLETRKSMREAYASIYEKKCVDKKDKGAHNCAKKVCHEEYGEGETIFGQHAVPDENGFVSHYDVQFEHGIVENVSVEDMEVLTLVEHPTAEGHRYEGEMISEEEVDVFDVIKGHLIDEGYADSEESALAIMANMTEEQRTEIIEGIIDNIARTAGTVVGTGERAVRELPGYLTQKVNNVKSTFNNARERASSNNERIRSGRMPLEKPAGLAYGSR